jgi:hypothetical protein
MTKYRAWLDVPKNTCRPRLYAAAAITLVVCMSGCMSKPPARIAPPVEAAPVAPAPEQPPEVISKPQPVKPPPRKPVVKAPEAPAPVPPTPVIAQIIGMSQDDLRKAFGEPAERIDQGPGQAWVYRTPKCTVEVLFFLDVTRNGYYALDRKTSVPDGAAERACYMDIQNARQH